MKLLTFLFKIWVMVMLVGYFILFLVILVGAIAATIAISLGGKGKSRGGKGGIFYLVIKLFELFARIWFYGQIMKGPRTKAKGRPLHKAVFAFIFGEPDPQKEWDNDERKYIISFIQSHKGIITLEELMAITGKNTREANELINSYLLEYEGEPQVTAKGSILFFFPELLRTAETLTARNALSLTNPSKKQLVPFNYKEKKKNAWIAFFNGFNHAFGSTFYITRLLSPILFGKQSWLGVRKSMSLILPLSTGFLMTF